MPRGHTSDPSCLVKDQAEPTSELLRESGGDGYFHEWCQSATYVPGYCPSTGHSVPECRAERRATEDTTLTAADTTPTQRLTLRISPSFGSRLVR